MSSSRTKRVACLGALALAAMLVPAAPSMAQGTVYVQSNHPVDDGNSLFAIRYRDDGSLWPMQMTEYPTGGKGTVELLAGPPEGVLDADQQVIMNPARTLLFTVNQGSDSIAVFRVSPGGGLEPVPGSPFPSGGVAPGSLGMSGDHLVVVNKAKDALRDLADDVPNHTVFRIASSGALSPVANSTVGLPKLSNPTQALVSPNGRFVFDALFAGRKLTAERIDDAGTLTPTMPPLELDPATYEGVTAPAGLAPEILRIPLGLAHHPGQRLVYVNAVVTGRLATYSYDDRGAMRFESAVENDNAFLPCWIAISRDGRRLYTSNTYTDTLSVFDIESDPKRPRQIQSVSLKLAGSPSELAFDPTGQFLFVITPRNQANVSPGEGNTLHTLRVDAGGRLEELETSPIPLPVHLGTSPQGIAVLGD